MKAILGKKLGMTQIFDKDGLAVPVTLIEAGPCYITQLKTQEQDGYSAVQLGFEELPERKINKPEKGHLDKANVPPLRHLREVRVDDSEQYETGQQILASVFEVGDKVDVTGTSKGKGFAGVVKRHGFRGGPKTHGQSDRHRAPGSVGAGTSPGRIFKGVKMAGQMGNERVTIQNLTVALVDAERNLLGLKGAVPGANNGYVMINRAVKSA